MTCQSCGHYFGESTNGLCPRCGSAMPIGMVATDSVRATLEGANPYAPPKRRVEVDAPSLPADSTAQLREIALWQRRLIQIMVFGLLMVLGLGFGITLFQPATTAAIETISTVGLQVVGIGFRVAYAYCCYQFAAALGSNSKRGWAIGGAIFTYIAAIILSIRATKRLKAAGFKVGLFGANMEQFGG